MTYDGIVEKGEDKILSFFLAINYLSDIIEMHYIK